MRSLCYLTCLSLFTLWNIQAPAQRTGWLQQAPGNQLASEKFADSLIQTLTLSEKVSLLSGMGTARSEFGDKNVPVFGIKGIPEKGIPDVIMGHGLTGVRTGRDVSVHSTYFCTPIAMGCSWNIDLYERVGKAIALEMRGLGQDLNLGPTINIIRHPLGGRSWESLSEDPFLTSRFIVPYVHAMQENGIICGPKHFVANNQDGNRFDINNEVDERAMREIYLPAFKSAVTEGGALNIMASYNRLNGVYMCQNQHLLSGILRNEWGFGGFVLSDFSFGVHSTLAAVYSGLDVEMPGPKYYGEKLEEAIKEGAISTGHIDKMLRNVIVTMHRTGIFSRPRVEHASLVHSRQHQDIALEVAREAPVLLKNENNLLPVSTKKLKSISIIGPNARRFPSLPFTNENYANYLQGGGSGRSYYFPGAVVTPYDGLKNALGKKVRVSYSQGCLTPDLWGARKNKAPNAQEEEKLIKEAVQAARNAEVAVIFAGLSGFNESEGWDRKSALLPGKQNELIRRVAKVNPRTVVVLIAGSYVDVSPWINQVNALLFVPYCGEKIGEGIADILLGRLSPSGKLPVSWPESVKDYPAGSIFTGGPYTKEGISNKYAEGVFVGYRWFQKQNIPVQYPFGFGLSYSDFEYSNLEVEPASWLVKVTIRVKNTGSVTASETAQLYVGEETPVVERPLQELKGFQKISLTPGESKVLIFQLDESAFAFYDVAQKKWKVEGGNYIIRVGGSSSGPSERKVISLKGSYLNPE